jgi:predicted kinase
VSKALSRTSANPSQDGDTDMTTAHLIHGYLCAGKTTVAKELERRLGAVRFSPDEMMISLYGGNPPDDPWTREKFDDYFRRVRTVMDELWPRALLAGADVILDFGLWSRADRDATRSLAANAGAQTRMYFVRCSDATARMRCRERNDNLEGSFHIDEEAFETLRSRFEPLGSDEECELIETDHRGIH